MYGNHAWLWLVSALTVAFWLNTAALLVVQVVLVKWGGT